jgi:hypothetical protein
MRRYRVRQLLGNFCMVAGEVEKRKNGSVKVLNISRLLLFSPL